MFQLKDMFRKRHQEAEDENTKNVSIITEYKQVRIFLSYKIQDAAFRIRTTHFFPDNEAAKRTNRTVEEVSQRRNTNDHGEKLDNIFF